MSPFNNLLFFASILFSLSNFATYLGFDKIKSFFFASDGFDNENKSRLIKYSGTKKKTKRLDCEKRMLLDKYNSQLNRHLRTLNYLSVIEADSKFNKNKTQIDEILNIKAQVQKDVIEITSKINQFKLKYKIASSI